MNASADALMGIFGFKRVEDAMKTDRELLELAAKAAGISGSVYSFPGMLERYGFNEAIYDDASDSHWNPLTDDGDALRLAVRFEFSLRLRHSENSVLVYGGPHGVVDEGVHGDPNAATRRAIVRAAAAIGESMQ